MQKQAERMGEEVLQVGGAVKYLSRTASGRGTANVFAGQQYSPIPGSES